MFLRRVARFGVLTFLIVAGSAGVATPASTESLSLCGQCLNPSITSKSGMGTANAVAEARITRQDAMAWCSNWHPEDKNCANGQLASDEAKKNYRASANCTTGKITTIDGKSYTQGGVWTADAGKGRARFRDAGGAIVGQDEGSGGLAIAEQWEILCPGVLNATALAGSSTVTGRSLPQPAARPEFAAGDRVEAKYGRDWIRGKIRKVAETQGRNGPELNYDVLLDNGKSGLLPADMVRRISAGNSAMDVPAKPIADQGARQQGGSILPSAQAPPVCGGQSNCDEDLTFAARLTDFRTSISGRFRVASATIRFQNKTNGQLILGYVNGSGVITDDQGNRYTINSPGAVSAMGIIANQVDTKFALQPGEASDARFEFSWVPGRAVIGTSFDMDLTIREIHAGGGDQVRLGTERLIHFNGLGRNSSAPVSAGDNRATGRPDGAMSPANSSPAVPEANPCGAAPRCYSAGPFTANVEQLIATQQPGQTRIVRMNVRFHNVSGQPLILGYMAKTSSIIDNHGNQFYSAAGGAVDTGVSGMGMVQAGKADTSFVLNPGESRNATFQVFRKRDNSMIGTSFSWTVNIAQLQILENGQQVHTIREYSVSVPDMAGSGGNANDEIKKLGDIFNGKKK